MKKSASVFQRCKDAKGFSMIEILIGISILSIGLLAVAAMQISVVKNNKTGNTFTQASALARSQMELIKDSDISDSLGILNPAVFPTTFNDPDNPLDENGMPGGIYNLAWIVDNYMEDTDQDGIPDTACAFARTVTVTVTFPFIGNATRQVSLTSIVAGGGL
jgi:type IV pilus assembly protein PilV